ncbi:transcriptional regulator, ArsR family [Halarchaeum acidiphilum MH1-52-1]|uniref:Transcriptional regulator, ArsR family n=1 Tax=Halarchaeum acidiphilum MH1-52-1 TaxID=1261545 RepID=U2YGT5_9EURY|nr:helix-turn-helix domain-containing protein [Halarchaeum acidiphilum]GAD53576.1 transcriptional regulator, ArsR family [Halarchaeum acidiphilum MH1-52-1]
MGSLFPFRSDVDADAGSPRLVGIDEDAADEVFDALGSRTARRILTAIYDDPRPASALADAVDTSLQNARYHLDNLSDAGLVTVADTWYSERGTEMKVYAPANDAVVVFAGDDGTKTGAFDVLKRFLGGVVGVALGALVVQALLAPESLLPAMGTSGGSSGSGASGTPTASGGSGGFSTMDVRRTTTTTATTTSASGGGHGPLALLAEPGVAFFLGGICVLLVVATLWYVRTRRRG